ncbi:chemotaxis protein CheD [Chitinispirillales bacterium ANBcel5]|uniref:chemotaxis protein CheD n=1 Tax=Cellulosispirillum alkaliphilum TaxID=3039283 RepID=UPI002A539930|nr:chemotaxis protein CheD [Chitinispirillales bacterium ANBcel5]
MKHIVGVSDMIITDNKDDIIVTHALGSCIGVAVYDPVACVGGVLHYMLPRSGADSEKAKKNPLMFGDTGIPILFESAYKAGAIKKRMRVVIAGGAQVFACENVFDIGKRNTLIARKLFWKNNILISAEDVGGNKPRTMYLEMQTGKTWFTSRGEYKEL